MGLANNRRTNLRKSHLSLIFVCDYGEYKGISWVDRVQVKCVLGKTESGLVC